MRRRNLLFAIPMMLALIQFGSAAANQVGTWRRSQGDAGASFTVLLQLRADQSYTKTLRGESQGMPLGGTHEGTWKEIDEDRVRLSGDGNWPSTVEDLRGFTRVR